MIKIIIIFNETNPYYENLYKVYVARLFDMSCIYSYVIVRLNIKIKRFNENEVKTQL